MTFLPLQDHKLCYGSSPPPSRSLACAPSSYQPHQNMSLRGAPLSYHNASPPHQLHGAPLSCHNASPPHQNTSLHGAPLSYHNALPPHQNSSLHTSCQRSLISSVSSSPLTMTPHHFPSPAVMPLPPPHHHGNVNNNNHAHSSTPSSPLSTTADMDQLPGSPTR